MVKEETKQFLTLCGRGQRSSLRLLKHGLAVAEMADSPLPGNPNNIFTIRKNVADEYDSYIVVSFLNATLVLSIGDTVEEVKGTGPLRFFLLGFSVNSHFSFPCRCWVQ